MWPLENLCIVSARPQKIHILNGVLHKDGAPSVEYKDGTKCYTLNGIPVKDWHSLTPSSKIDPKKVLAEENADIRRELIRKVGIERMLSVLPHKVLNTVGDYQLLSVNLGNGVADARYLKMLNPSIGIWHLEGVHPDCGTVQHAINWRAGNINEDWKPEVLT